MQSSLLLASAVALVLLGAGCNTKTVVAPVVTPVSVTTAPAVKTAEPVGASTSVSIVKPLSCPSGTTSFVATTLNVEFCYPTVNNGGKKVTVKEESNGVLLFVDGVKTQKVGVLTVPTGKTAKSFLTSSYINTDVAKNVVCSLLEAPVSDTLTYYTISGEIDGDQNIEAVGICQGSTLLTQLFDNLGVGQFFVYSSSPSTLFFLNDERTSSLNSSHMEEFKKSIQSKN